MIDIRTPSRSTTTRNISTPIAPEPIRQRVAQSRAVMVRSEPMITFKNGRFPILVETLFEQVSPGHWKYSAQLVEVDVPITPEDMATIDRWAEDRRRRFIEQQRRNNDVVLRTLAATFESGIEGLDYVLLRHAPPMTIHS
ncbi:MAG: hypothetical protein MK077_09760 [Phycisphaerales bacterium]|nr:hypothetical protein [Phycisphaerales bacterium]